MTRLFPYVATAASGFLLAVALCVALRSCAEPAPPPAEVTRPVDRLDGQADAHADQARVAAPDLDSLHAAALADGYDLGRTAAQAQADRQLDAERARTDRLLATIRTEKPALSTPSAGKTPPRPDTVTTVTLSACASRLTAERSACDARDSVRVARLAAVTAERDRSVTAAVGYRSAYAAADSALGILRPAYQAETHAHALTRSDLDRVRRQRPWLLATGAAIGAAAVVCLAVTDCLP